MAKKVLVTGGAGFIGSHTVNELIQRGDSVRVFDNLNPQVHGENAEKPHHLHPDAEFIKGDVRDRDHLKKAIEDIDLVIHDAAEVGVGQSMYSIDQYISTNVQGTGVLWDILVNEKHKVEKVLVASSMSLYGEGYYLCNEHGKVSPEPRPENQLAKGVWDMLCPTCSVPMTPIPTDENKELDCTSVYAQSKKDQEVYSLMIGKAHRIPTVACRYFNCYGPYQSLNNPYTGAAAIFCSAVKNDTSPLIYEDGNQRRDFIHVKDLVCGKLLLLDHEDSNYGVFNIGTGTPSSILELVEAIIELCGKDFKPNVTHKFRSGDIRDCYADISGIKALGFEAKLNLREGLKDLMAWSESQQAVSRVQDAHQKLVEKGLILDTP
ncbi:MAG: SDR family NAD(P)-dependent oxidoreductase [Nitrospina sp.]|jgi:dTDP-L-rhamnose 4-epimerase|nr:SDR family NAD(P)-dependent oxidoreductase [Nitrospina sp.]MBT3508091.1 SDR family NAD(P)-dependent oxidoreductase [Nitrospina sp.]MBT3875710.1 SDR family NAD(P)-dependent oxidoreductase [Nitrospina sp.]MBT4049637.1 SDR family NAD(P)-dependent oxidoreductase [Nitrospina sp.]MBT4558349.1 SDR family NAD(P)-dependent oxidoreductase [Nitrospina sp.]